MKRDDAIPFERLVFFGALAFLAGALLGCDRAPVEACRVTGVDTSYIVNAAGDSLRAIVTTKWGNCG